MNETKRGDKFVVQLWESQTASLLVEAPTGAIYTNQCGGTACSHPEVEGFEVPVSYFDDGEAYKLLCDFWFEPVGDPCWVNLIEERLTALNTVVAGYINAPNNMHMKVDESRIYTMAWGEAWVPVTSAYGPGILTWMNSD